MLNYQPAMLDEGAVSDARIHWDSVAKPLHSLGKLEDLVAQMAGIYGTSDVQAFPRCALVFCADHGVVAEKVSQSGQEVTALVAQSVADGTANINLMAKAANTDVYAVDMGIAADVAHPAILVRKTAHGTANMTKLPAMTRTQAEAAIQAGIDLVGEMKARGYRLIATGEMGIGNTTSSTAMACALLGRTPQALTGRGAGLSDAGLARKVQAIDRALALHQPRGEDAMDVLEKVGGFEIAGMAGAFLGGMTHHVPVVIDGVISAVAALTAARLCPSARSFMLPSHISREPAGALLMEALEMKPIVHGDMALGEGTGAVTLFPLLDMALQIYHGPHTFDELGMEAYTPQGGKA